MSWSRLERSAPWVGRAFGLVMVTNEMDSRRWRVHKSTCMWIAVRTTLLSLMLSDLLRCLYNAFSYISNYQSPSVCVTYPLSSSLSFSPSSPMRLPS